MDFVGKAKRVRIYVEENDAIGHKPAPYALLDWLRREGAAGATLIRATAGVGTSGHLNLDLMPDASPHLPVIVEWVDAPDRVDRLLPRLKEMVSRGLACSCASSSWERFRPRSAPPRWSSSRARPHAT